LRVCRGLVAALGMLSVLPAARGRAPEPEDLAAAVPFFPVVGGLFGLVLWGAYRGLEAAGLPDPVRGALLTVLLVLLTGGLHLDGLADTCDGLAGTTRERRLAIMADTATGAFGVVGVACLLLVKAAALSALEAAAALPALVLAPVLGRWAMVLALFAFPYARGQSGLGYHFKEGARWPALVVATAFAAAPALALLPAGTAAGAVGLAGVVTLGLGRWMSARLGGLTGDVYGAVCEVVETATLITVPLLVRTAGLINSHSGHGVI